MNLNKNTRYMYVLLQFIGYNTGSMIWKKSCSIASTHSFDAVAYELEINFLPHGVRAGASSEILRNEK